MGHIRRFLPQNQKNQELCQSFTKLQLKKKYFQFLEFKNVQIKQCLHWGLRNAHILEGLFYAVSMVSA